ncbi:MAG: SpoIIE family protein phosphatase [Acidobacteriota bacterium]|nr:SpoIIE family protein phosphatase [Acidobacteriota bacterium]
MRVLKPLNSRFARRIARRARQLRRRLTVARIVLLVEILLLGVALLVVLRAGPEVYRSWPLSDSRMLACLLLFTLAALLHLSVARRIIRRIETYLSPAAYDERRILLDIGEEARTADSLRQFYDSVLARLKEALEAENVAIFVRDEATDEFVCSACVPDHEVADKGSPESKLALSRDAFIIKRLRHLATPLLIEPGDFEAWERAFLDATPERREARQREGELLKRLNARLLLQIKIKDQVAGLVLLGPRRGRHDYSARDREMLMSLAGQLAFVIENAKLVERIASQEQLRRELLLAAEVQQRFLPGRPPVLSHLELSGICQPARGIGGDYYDFLLLDDKQVGIAVADVAGKGISAALVMSSVQAALRSQTMAISPARPSVQTQAEMVSSINRLLCQSTSEATYVTFFYAEFNEQTRQLTYVNAGHNPPLLFRAHNSAEEHALTQSVTTVAGDLAHAQCFRLDKGGPVIGLFEHSRYEQETVSLRSGDLLIAYTDGVTEALDSFGEEFGEGRLQTVIAEHLHSTAETVRDALMRTVSAWSTGAPQYDDLTLVIMKVN